MAPVTPASDVAVIAADLLAARLSVAVVVARVVDGPQFKVWNALFEVEAAGAAPVSVADPRFAPHRGGLHAFRAEHVATGHHEEHLQLDAAAPARGAQLIVAEPATPAETGAASAARPPLSGAASICAVAERSVFW